MRLTPSQVQTIRSTAQQLLSARLASRVSRAMQGRRVDVVLKAPNLMPQPIHQIAQQTGVVLPGLPTMPHERHRANESGL